VKEESKKEVKQMGLILLLSLLITIIIAMSLVGCWKAVGFPTWFKRQESMKLIETEEINIAGKTMYKVTAEVLTFEKPTEEEK